MTENNKENQSDIGEVPTSPLFVHRQFLKDLSFENPNAPRVLKPTNQKPETDINIGVDVQKHDHDEIENYYEVSLNITTNAVRNQDALFLVDITYGAAVSVNGLEENQHHPLLFIEVPKLLFPFARQIVSHTTQSGGFMPLQIGPIDFRAMYLQRFANQAEEQTQEKAN